MICSRHQYDCTQAPESINADADIGGKGVLISFILTAGLSVVAVCIMTILDSPHLAKLFKEWLPWFRLGRKDLWDSCLLAALLSLSDQQLVTGIGLEIATAINMCTLRYYHLGIVAKLVTVSTITHAVTLLHVQDYLIDHKWLFLGRLILVSLSFLVNAVAIIGFYSGNDWPKGQLVICAFRGPHSPGNIVLNMFAYLLAVIILALPLTIALAPRQYLRENKVKCKGIPLYYVQKVMVLGGGGAVSFIAIQDLVQRSQAFGTPEEVTVDSSENEWGFGQVMAILLPCLLLPISVSEISSDEHLRQRRDNKMMALLRRRGHLERPPNVGAVSSSTREQAGSSAKSSRINLSYRTIPDDFSSQVEEDRIPLHSINHYP